MNKFWKILISIILVVITLGVVAQAGVVGYCFFNQEACLEYAQPFMELREKYHDMDRDLNVEALMEDGDMDRFDRLDQYAFNHHSRFGFPGRVYGFGSGFFFLALLVGGFFLVRSILRKNGVRVKIEKESEQQENSEEE
jgi:hypothetical protein